MSTATRPQDSGSTVRVSVVLPTYQRRDLAVEAAASALSQSLPAHEVLVVDDGSTDGTPEALRAAFGEDSRLRVLEQANGGTAAARNRGVLEARGDLIAFLDSDDLWQPDYLRSQVAALERSGADAVLCEARYEDGGPSSASQFQDARFLPPLSLEAMIAGAWGLPSALVVRSEVARSLRFDPGYRYGEDSEFLFRFHAAGHSLVLNPEPLATWRRHGAGRKTEERDLHHLLNDIRMLLPHRDHPRARQRMRANLYAMHRAVAKDLVRQGRWREARPHLAHCLRRRPDRPRLWWRWLRGALARPAEGALEAGTRARLARVEEATRQVAGSGPHAHR